ncbi:hypothetical protein [Murinocardiopsis flavida]|nr:hypothetical protein [Murinocardiopsis flavida]
MEPFKDSFWWAIKRPRTTPCEVRVAHGELTITHDPGAGVPMVRVPTAGLEIITPGRVRRLEAGVVLRIAGKPVAVMFDQVYARQRLGAAKEQGAGAFVGQAAQPAANVRGNMGLARSITARFLAALLAGGAVDTTSGT